MRPSTRLEDIDLELLNALKKKATVSQAAAMLKSRLKFRLTFSTKLDNIHAMITALTQKADNLKTTSGPQDFTEENELNRLNELTRLMAQNSDLKEEITTLKTQINQLS
ncbi:uncharacterized protein BDCG_07935 [Blastomyces dermatitidis ER-3]|uniref:Uncharacterized protein n=1 Tax=Ajellomyces dermatitidis (strain ER-3 / ATCC MYA-2586) TaxID=559297 RepID=A0ABP2ESV1_AJEDR|nr:uncharacterized protein BDCG_07935 [Blastomyces dermatitidis ER-3]EEQ84666.2 hypothetical protein BDCG_07935 [Blastomyces dermatitidis ER-3]